MTAAADGNVTVRRRIPINPATTLPLSSASGESRWSVNPSLSWSLSSALTDTTVRRCTRAGSDLPGEPPRTPPYGHADSWKAPWTSPNGSNQSSYPVHRLGGAEQRQPLEFRSFVRWRAAPGSHTAAAGRASLTSRQSSPYMSSVSISAVHGSSDPQSSPVRCRGRRAVAPLARRQRCI